MTPNADAEMVQELVMERFRLGERLGSGGMGTVYRAFDERLQREVAIKEVRIQDDGGRVRREAQAAARLNHPAIVALYELGIEGDRALLVSELVHGATLDRLVLAGELSDRDVAEAGIDVCAGLAHAHHRGVVHRDIKPQNVIVRDDGAGRVAKVLDFGIASLAGAPTLTASGEVVGTLAYMAPEQADGAIAGPAADVYSLALTLYCAWAGEHPVAAPTPALTARRIGGVLPSLAEHRPDLPPELVDAIDACLEAEPSLRPSTTELAAELIEAAPRLDAAEPVPSPAGSEEASAGSERSLAGRLAALAAVLGASTLAVSGSLPVAGGLVLATTGFGLLVARRHLAVAVLAALLWAACLSAGLAAVGDGSLGERPALIALAAVAATLVAHRAGFLSRPRPRATAPGPALPSA
jgi:serine/threonine protein kinase